ncbi:MAG: TPM domain-containing protein [Ginsengibacter sp.]
MKIFFILLFGLIIGCFHAKAQVIPNYNPYSTMTPTELEAYRQSIWNTLPAAVGWVNDFEGLFSNKEEDSLERKINHLEKVTSIEIAIVTVDSNMVEGEEFNRLTDRLLKEWGIGKKSKSNGIVICISKDYRKLFISCDFGIDKYMDKDEKNKIINKYIIPYYQKDKYFTGTLNGLNAIIDEINKKKDRYN